MAPAMQGRQARHENMSARTQRRRGFRKPYTMGTATEWAEPNMPSRVSSSWTAGPTNSSQMHSTTANTQPAIGMHTTPKIEYKTCE
jgi:hypothetical protein